MHINFPLSFLFSKHLSVPVTIAIFAILDHYVLITSNLSLSFLIRGGVFEEVNVPNVSSLALIPVGTEEKRRQHKNTDRESIPQSYLVSGQGILWTVTAMTQSAVWNWHPWH